MGHWKLLSSLPAWVNPLTTSSISGRTDCGSAAHGSCLKLGGMRLVQPILLLSLALSLRSSSWLLFVPNSSISAEPSHALPCSCRYQLELLFELFSRPRPETRLPFEEFPRLFLQATKLFLFCTISSLQLLVRRFRVLWSRRRGSCG